LRHGFIYPFTSTAKRAMFGQRRDQRYTITWSEGCCVVRHIMKSDNWPHILQWHYQLRTLLWSDSLPLHWTFKWGRNCPWLLPTGWCYCTHSSCFHDATVWFVRGQNNFKGLGHLGRPNHPLIIVCGEQWKAQFTKIVLNTLFELKEAIANFI
jgi:hypothetical protein